MNDPNKNYRIIIKIDEQKNAKIPQKATIGSSGYDICSSEYITIPAKKYAKIPTGIYLEMPVGIEAQIRPRSGLAAKYGITVLNAPGTIDSDYRGEICILLINHGDNDFVVEKGMRIAQMVFSKILDVELIQSEKLEKSERGSGGFGSTGI